MKKNIIIFILLIGIAGQLFALDDADFTSNSPVMRVTVVVDGDVSINPITAWTAILYDKDGNTEGSISNSSNVEGCYATTAPNEPEIGIITIDLANMCATFNGGLGYDYRDDYVIAAAGHGGYQEDGATIELSYTLNGLGETTVHVPGGSDLWDNWYGGNIPITGTSTIMVPDANGDWGEGGILPVTLSSFTAAFSDGVPLLQWITQSEVNNSGWNVYRSETELQEESIKVNSSLISGSGTTSDATFYEFEDEYLLEQGASYNYWLESIAFNGATETHGPVSLYIPTEEEGETPEVPLVYGLHQNYPNPFNPDTYISFALEESGPVELDIYNIKGQRVIKLFNEEEVEKDVNIIVYWDGCNQIGRRVSSGVYFYRLKTTAKTYNRKMVLTK